MTRDTISSSVSNPHILTINSNLRNSRSIKSYRPREQREQRVYIHILEALSTVVRYLGSRANRVVRDISFSGSRACNAHVHTGWKCIITLGLFCTVEAHWAAPLLVLFEQFRPIESQPTRNSIAIPANNKARRTRCTRWKGRGRNISKSEKWSPPPPLQQIIRDVSRKFSYFVFFFFFAFLILQLFLDRCFEREKIKYISYCMCRIQEVKRLWKRAFYDEKNKMKISMHVF